MRACRLDSRCSIVLAPVTASAITLPVGHLIKFALVIDLVTAQALDITIPESILLRFARVRLWSCWFKTARAFGITIPQSILLRAHEVIQ